VARHPEPRVERTSGMSACSDPSRPPGPPQRLNKGAAFRMVASAAVPPAHSARGEGVAVERSSMPLMRSPIRPWVLDNTRMTARNLTLVEQRRLDANVRR
jgi:hypothetical protein